MSRIDELIAELCPDGVPFEALDAVTTNLDRLRKPVTRSARNAGDFPYYGANGVQDYVDTFIFDGTFLLVGEDGSVIQKNGAPLVNWASGKIWVNNHAHVLAQRSDDVLLRFIFYYLQTTDISSLITGGTQPKLNQANLNKIKVPVPPVEVQREIVRVLDLFASLEAELEARRVQYAHYRDSLMHLASSRFATCAMGEVGRFIRGRRFTKHDIAESGIPAIHYGDIYTGYGVAAYSALMTVRDDLAPQLRFAEQGDVVIAAVGETVADVAKAVAWIGDERVAIHDDTFLFRSDMNPKFVSYVLQTADFHGQKNKYVARAKVKRLSGESLAKIRIPVPPLEEQARVVAILDRFDALVNDLSVGLPAELQARRKQYEFYRGKLLTFKELAAA